MSDIEQRLRERATSYRQGGPSSEHTASILDEAADTIASLRSKLEEAEGALEPFAEAGKAMLLTGGKNPKLSGHRLAEHLECARRTLSALREADHA